MGWIFLPSESGADLDALLRYQDVSSHMSVAREYQLALNPGDAAYFTDVHLAASRHVSGRFVDADGRGIGASPDCATVLWETDVRSDKGFSVVGVQAGTASVLTVLLFPEVAELPIPAGDGELNLDDIPITRRPHDASVSIHLDNADAFDTRGGEVPSHPMLISADGTQLLELWSKHDVTVAGPFKVGPAPLPAGTYWISPTGWSAFGTSAALIQLVRSGVDLAESGIPRLVIAPGETREITLDVAAAQKAIRAFAEARGLGPGF